MAGNVSISITEVTMLGGKKKNIKIKIDDELVSIPVDESVHAYYSEQFFKPNPTPLQKKRFATLMNIARAAYLQGKKDAK